MRIGKLYIKANAFTKKSVKIISNCDKLFCMNLFGIGVLLDKKNALNGKWGG